MQTRPRRIRLKPVALIYIAYYLSGMIGAWLLARALAYKLICVLGAENTVYSDRTRSRAARLLVALALLPPANYTAEQRSAWALHWRRYLLGAVFAVIVSQVCLVVISNTS